MAGRKDKNTVDYFPHYCISGKTLFILESKFNHLGYAIWFKTLELLGNSENHYIDLRDDTDLLFLVSKLKITEQQLIEIYDLISKLGAIDSYLWSKKIVFSDNFIKNIDDAYKRRNNKCMQKCDLCKHLFNKCSNKCSDSKQESTDYTRVKESKEKESKDKIPTFEEFKIYALEKQNNIDLNALKNKYDSWVENGWKDGNDNKIKNWKSKLLNTLTYLPKTEANKKPFNPKRPNDLWK